MDSQPILSSCAANIGIIERDLLALARRSHFNHLFDDPFRILQDRFPYQLVQTRITRDTGDIPEFCTASQVPDVNGTDETAPGLPRFMYARHVFFYWTHVLLLDI